METVNSIIDGNQLQSLEPNAEATNEQLLNGASSSSVEKKKIKHVSALAVAAACRSAVQHAHLHIISNKPGDFAHSATNICYDV